MFESLNDAMLLELPVILLFWLKFPTKLKVPPIMFESLNDVMLL